MSEFATYPSLAGRVALITGGASGIGADIVRAFAANHARVAFIDIQDEAGEALARELAGSTHPPLYLHCDLTDIAALRATIAEVRHRLGPVAALVNNAANDDRHAFDAVTVEYWDRSQDINLRHHFFAAQFVHPHMLELGFGSIINFSSVTWRTGAGAMPSYVAAKAAIIGLTRSLATALGGDNIRVNAIEPGAVMTERQRQLWYQSDASIAAMVDQQLIRKVLMADEIARMVLFLAADDSRMITKQSFVVDAGLA